METVVIVQGLKVDDDDDARRLLAEILAHTRRHLPNDYTFNPHSKKTGQRPERLEHLLHKIKQYAASTLKLA